VLVGEGMGVRVGLGLGVGIAVGLGVGVAVGLGVGVAVGLGVGVAVGLGVGVAVGLGVGVKVGAGGWIGAGVPVGATGAIGTLSAPELIRITTAPTAAIAPTITTPMATGSSGNPPPFLTGEVSTCRTATVPSLPTTNCS